MTNHYPMPLVKTIKKDAQIPVVIGAGFFQKLQQLLFSILENKSEEELNQYSEHVTKNEEFSEPWMDNLHTIVILLREIEMSAEKHQMVSESSVDDSDIIPQES